ncbi:hypothetical protein Tco_0899350, partial [Tanacetum coccineum]
MLAPRSAKASHEKALLKLHGMRKLPGSPSFGGTLFGIKAELSLLRKEDEICSSSSSSFSKMIGVSESLGMVITEPGIRATTRSVVRFFVRMELFCFVDEVFDSGSGSGSGSTSSELEARVCIQGRICF